MVVYVNPNWTFRETVNNIKTLRILYRGELASFSLWQSKEWADYIVAIRKQFYALDLIEWQKDMLWNFMNGIGKLHKLQNIASRYK